jgi:flavin-dependent dehydrogenase
VIRTVAVLGGGPAGAIAAERIAGAGIKTVVFDEKLAWEKPCGGGLTYKAYRDYPFLLDGPEPKRVIHESTLATTRAGELKVRLSRPVLIYSRLELNRMLLARAERAGASLEKTRVLGMDPRADGDYCILATGARNPLRDAGTEWTAHDTMSALGYYIPGSQEKIEIQFLDDLEGYIWIFPRCGHLSVGICGKGEPAQALRARLERFLEKRGITFAGATFYSHMLPSLAQSSWPRNRIAGDAWLAVGDAAGLVDPITGEGLYYALRSGDVAGQLLRDDAVAPGDKAASYRATIDREFGTDLAVASRLAPRLFLGRFAMGSMPDRMIQMGRRSPLLREVLQDLFAGTQPYVTLKQRLLGRFRGTMGEVAASFFRKQQIA